ncbi:MAG: hypothetical protein Ct9H300mP27_10490 [Chloroflexota bacterium]|nr:MAG: hypothetical protein Ct9H300mP27_10490 [Chloroflexota bacterium]
MAIKSESYLKILEEDLYSPPTDQAPDPELLAAMVEMGKVLKLTSPSCFLLSIRPISGKH